jgi:hypothetical protein
MLGMENFLREFPATAVPKSDRPVATDNGINAQLARLHETAGIAVGTMLGMENFLREFPATA